MKNEDVKSKDPIELYAPPETFSQLMNREFVPTQKELISNDWKPVWVHCRSVKMVIIAGGYNCIRKQYTLRHDVSVSNQTKQK